MDTSGVTREQALASVGEGWKELVTGIYDAFEMFEYCSGQQVKVTQCKQRSGCIELSYLQRGPSPFTSKLRNLLDILVEMSQSRCEVCGDDGHPVVLPSRYTRTRCEEHAHSGTWVEV